MGYTTLMSDHQLRKYINDVKFTLFSQIRCPYVSDNNEKEALALC